MCHIPCSHGDTSINEMPAQYAQSIKYAQLIALLGKRIRTLLPSPPGVTTFMVSLRFGLANYAVAMECAFIMLQQCVHHLSVVATADVKNYI